MNLILNLYCHCSDRTGTLIRMQPIIYNTEMQKGVTNQDYECPECGKKIYLEMEVENGA
jgi:hypothetical protein